MGRVFFPDLLGNESIKQNLAFDASSGKTAHAYIIEGEEGSGRHLLTRLISAAVVCSNRSDSTHPVPCGTCPTCLRILRGISADVTVIGTGGKASIGVDAIRRMREDLYVTPNDAEKKFIIIEQADLMTTQAQNSLLLSLEEPPAYVMFFLIVTHAAGLLETIRSRAPVVRMEIFSPKRILEIFGSGQFINPNDYSADTLTEAAYLSGGTIGRALRVLTEGEDGANHRSTAARLTEMLAGKTPASVLLSFITESFPTERENVLSILQLTRNALRDLLACRKSKDNLLFYLSESDLPEDAGKISPRRLILLSDAVKRAYDTIAINGSVNTALTELVLKKDQCR